MTWLASTIVGSIGRPSAATDAATCSLRLDVAIAQAMLVVLDRLDEASDAGKGARRAVQPRVDLAGPLVDLLGSGLVDRPAGERRDLAGEALAVEPDERRELAPVGRIARLGERLQPGLDPGRDRVDERPVEVEEDGFRDGQVVDGDRHLSAVTSGGRDGCLRADGTADVDPVLRKPRQPAGPRQSSFDRQQQSARKEQVTPERGY